MARAYTEEQRLARAARAKEWRARNPDKVAANRSKERAAFDADPASKAIRNANARSRFAEKMKCPEYRKFHAERTSRAKAKNPVSHICTYTINAAKRRATQYGLAFDLHDHAEELRSRISALTCEMSGIPLKGGTGKRQFNSVSIDRIDPAKGYLYGNIRVIAWCLNAAFGDWGEANFTAVAEAWVEQRKKKVETDA